MYKLLLVDDEHWIVDSLYAVFEERSDPELRVYKAYSGEEALAVLDQTKIDIVLSDIRMPGLSGLELQDEIRRRRQDCKIIFLTGYDESELVRKAVREGAINYILKSEEDAIILDSIQKALESIREERRGRNFLDSARRQLRLALPALRSECLKKMCEGSRTAGSLSPDMFEDLAVKPDLQKPVLLVLGKVDEWRPSDSLADQRLLLSALENIGEECFAGFTLVKASFDDRSFVWALQPAEQQEPLVPEGSLNAFAYGTLETVQQIAKEILQLTVSFAIVRDPIAWSRLRAGYACLKRSLIRRLDGELVTVVNVTEDAAMEQRLEEEQQIRMLFGKLLEEGGLQPEQSDESCRIIEEIQQLMDSSSPEPALYSEMYLSLVAGMLSGVKDWGGKESAPMLEGVWKLLEGDRILRPAEGLEEIRKLLTTWNEWRQTERLEAGSRIVAAVHRYIEEHLNEELSLTVLAEKVFLNPAYLSRVYKARTGKNLIDHINESRIAKAKDLLDGTLMKVVDVARSVGIESPAYFTRLYKKMTGFTPQEYRESAFGERVKNEQRL
ncbi:response regulator [Cohnella sp.]|uniref:response regulator transcription factor n=1 Tax=Cohnella sp. TaxID=1883426 RepID=UPI003566E06A